MSHELSHTWGHRPGGVLRSSPSRWPPTRALWETSATGHTAWQPQSQVRAPTLPFGRTAPANAGSIVGVGQRVPVGNVVVRGHAAQGDMKVVARCVIASSVRDVLAALRSDLVEKRFFTAGHRMDNTSVPTTMTSHAEPPVSERSTRKVLVGRQPVPAQGTVIYTAEHS